MSTIILLASSFLTFFITSSFSVNTEGLSLISLKFAISSDPSGVLANWSSAAATPCNWTGVICTGDRVTGLTLPNNGLTGYIPSELSAILGLEHLILAHNNFSGPIPSHLFSSSLLHLDLSQNSLSGNIPQDIQSLTSLIHLDLSLNRLNGPLPSSLPLLRNLHGTVNLSFNLFSGEIPTSYGDFPVMVSLDIRHNNLSGRIPQVGSLLNQGPTAFAGNPGLCGFPLQVRCSGDSGGSGGSGYSGVTSTEVPLNPEDSSSGGGRQWKRGEVVVLFCSGASVVVFVVSMWVVVVRKRGWFNGSKGVGVEEEEEGEGEGKSGGFRVVDDGFVFGIEDLLRATALVVGKGRSGIVYRVVVGRGSCSPPHEVAVRRLSEEMGALPLREFQAAVMSMTRVQRHPNVVGIKAFYYTEEEKLLVSDFIGSGNSLHTALFGGGGMPPLSWGDRLRIARGVAKGLMHIHECWPGKLVHGRIKASKILLDHNLHPYISGFGLAHLTSISSSKKPSPDCVITDDPCATAYVAPEGRGAGGRVTQKGEVYSFGVLLLEIVTGKVVGGRHECDGSMGMKGMKREALVEVLDPLISGEDSNSAVLAMGIALDCTNEEPKLRPRMRRVNESLELL